MIDVENRLPEAGKAGRVKFTQDNGIVLNGVLQMDDAATKQGTPWDRNTGKLLQADIRTYPVATGQSITAGDVVDVVGGAVTKAGTPSQAIALTNAAAGQNCEVIYSGVASLPGITAGQKITSDGVYGVGVLTGVLQVWSKDRPGTKVITGSYTGTAGVGVSGTWNTISIGAKATCFIIAGSNGSYMILIRPLTQAKKTEMDDQNCTVQWSNTGVSIYSSGSGVRNMNYTEVSYSYVAILEGNA